ncbi:hypothetical protein TSUD_326440 [Trifolium subterraneum]|uniref:Reverse transcriptase zinc-binding domain-containing protein n=1 Tax=Trifolium subterraneum TaxID=3900 RepID=A0A2Z6NEA9_TRISU|nr:hypothetical protein TSUD_326440 [Trifolium subterraneum]
MDRSGKEGKGEEEIGFKRLASFVFEFEPLSQEDLQAIDATLQSSLPKPTTTTTVTTTTTPTPTNKRPFTSHSPTRHRSRRRLPTSLIALQLPRSLSFSPSPGLDKCSNSSSSWWRDLNSIVRLVMRGGMSWFDDHLSEVVGDGVDRLEREEVDRLKWGDNEYSVKDAYQLLSEEELGEAEWDKDVWNNLILSKMAILVWRLFQGRLPTKENLRKGGDTLNSSSLCVGGCGEHETENHLFFNCPIFSAVWKEIVRWLGVPVSFTNGGYEHLVHFKNIVPGNLKFRERIGVIWFSVIFIIGKLEMLWSLDLMDLIGRRWWKRSKCYLGEFLD